MGVASLLSLLRNRAVFWLKTIFCVSYLFFFICLFFVFVYLYLADHQGGWEFCLLPDPLADVSLDPGSQSPQACVTIRPQWTQDALSPESDLQPAHFPPSPSKPLATCVLVWDTIDRFNRWQILFLSKKLIRFQIRIHVSKKKSWQTLRNEGQSLVVRLEGAEKTLESFCPWVTSGLEQGDIYLVCSVSCMLIKWEND